jgi:hypothetical protein
MPRPGRLYFFDSPAGLADLQTSIDMLYSPEEMAELREIRRQEPMAVLLPEVLLSGSVGRGKVMSPNLMIREYLSRRRVGDYGYKLYAMWRILCRTAGYKVPTYDYFRLLLYRLRRLQLITSTQPGRMWNPDMATRMIPRVVVNKTMFRITRFGMQKYPFQTLDTEGNRVTADAVDRMWRAPQDALYDPHPAMKDAAAKYLAAAEVARIGWPR